MRPSERGTILITVLWVVTVLAIIVLGLVFEARRDVDRTILLRDRSRAYWLARAGIEAAKYDLALAKVNADPENQAKSYYRYDLDMGRVECAVASDSARMPVNTTAPELWRQALLGLKVEQGEADQIVDAILDWRDQDDETRINGAERDHYLSETPAYEPRNGPFMSVEELLLVRGISEELFYGAYSQGQRQPGLVDLVGLGNANQPRLDINSANEAVLMVFLQISREEALAIIEARQQQPFTNVQEAGALIDLEAADNLEQFFMAYQGNQYTIRCTGNVYNSPARYTVEEVARYVGGGQLFVTIAHKDFSLDHAQGVEENP